MSMDEPDFGIGWRYVDPFNRFKDVTGTVASGTSIVSTVDWPSTHLSHDQNFTLSVDPQYSGLVSDANGGVRTDPVTGDPVIDPTTGRPEKTEMEVDWETGISPHDPKQTTGDGNSIFPKMGLAKRGGSCVGERQLGSTMMATLMSSTTGTITHQKFIRRARSLSCADQTMITPGFRQPADQCNCHRPLYSW